MLLIALNLKYLSQRLLLSQQKLSWQSINSTPSDVLALVLGEMLYTIATSMSTDFSKQEFVLILYNLAQKL